MSSAIIVASRYAIPPLDQYGPGFRHTQRSAFSQQVLDIAEAEGEPGIEPDGLLDDHGWEAISSVADLGHDGHLRPQNTPNKPSNARGGDGGELLGGAQGPIRVFLLSSPGAGTKLKGSARSFPSVRLRARCGGNCGLAADGGAPHSK